MGEVSTSDWLDAYDALTLAEIHDIAPVDSQLAVPAPRFADPSLDQAVHACGSPGRKRFATPRSSFSIIARCARRTNPSGFFFTGSFIKTAAIFALSRGPTVRRFYRFASANCRATMPPTGMVR